MRTTTAMLTLLLALAFGSGHAAADTTAVTMCAPGAQVCQIVLVHPKPCRPHCVHPGSTGRHPE